MPPVLRVQSKRAAAATPEGNAVHYLLSAAAVVRREDVAYTERVRAPL